MSKLKATNTEIVKKSKTVCNKQISEIKSIENESLYNNLYIKEIYIEMYHESKKVINNEFNNTISRNEIQNNSNNEIDFSEQLKSVACTLRAIQ